MALLKQFETDFGDIRITRSKRDGSMAYYQNGCFHSQINKRGESVCAYIHAIHEIVRQIHAKHVLIIGCAGGSLATMLKRLHCKVTAVDINPLAFMIARRYFQLPDDVRCVRRDGIEYLRNTRKFYDAIVIDVFGSQNTVPRAFTSSAFFQKVQRVLTPGGVMIMNIITVNDDDGRADDIARHAKATGMDITMFDWPNEMNRNTLVVAGITPHVHIPSGQEPRWMKDDFKGIIRRKPKKRLYV